MPDAAAIETQPPDPRERIDWLNSTPIILTHLAPLLAIVWRPRWQDWVLCFVLYYVRMFFLTAGYHRYFAHRSYHFRTDGSGRLTALGRLSQFLMAFGSATCAQKGPLWWAAIHRHHHLASDTPEDAHSPTRGFWWSHMGWFACGKYKATRFDLIKDFARYPELRWLNRWWILPPTMLAVACWMIGGASALLIGFFLSTVVLYHGTFIVNSLAHLFGRRRYATEDASRNSTLIALVTLGEGYHNNHHHCQKSARQGFYWWEFDQSWYFLMVFSWLGIVRDMRAPTRDEMARNRLKAGVIDAGLAAYRQARQAWREARKKARLYYREKKREVGEAFEKAEAAVRAARQKPETDP